MALLSPDVLSAPVAAIKLPQPAAAREAGWSVYVHFPYCLHRCSYCDFATTVTRDIPREGYLAAILNELALRTEGLVAAPLRTIFFGGGTPSLWGPACIGRVLRWLDDWGGISENTEITMEANPGALEIGDLAGYAAAGINRVSIGVQALADDRLRALDRLHDAQGARNTLAQLQQLLQNGQLKSASADLIFGGPGQTQGDLRHDLQQVLDYGLPHLSAYSLTVEPETPLFTRVKRGLQQPPDDDLQAEMLQLVPQWVAAYGLTRYEVSNFAQPQRQCRHNLAYWQGDHYLAVGVGAHGFLPLTGQVGRRYANTRAHNAWLTALGRHELAEEFQEDIDKSTHLTERLLTGLRLDAGLDLAALRRDIGGDLVGQLLSRVARQQRRGAKFILDNQHLRIEAAQMQWLDGLISQIA